MAAAKYLDSASSGEGGRAIVVGGCLWPLAGLAAGVPGFPTRTSMYLAC